MRLLFISKYGEAFPLALHCERYGTQVSLYAESGHVGEGLINPVRNLVAEAKESEYAVITNSTLHPIEKQISKWCPTIGGTRFEHQLNNDIDLVKNLYKLGGGLSSFLPHEDEYDNEVVVGAFCGKGGFRLPAVIASVSKGMYTGDRGLKVDGVGVTVTSDPRRQLYKLLLDPFNQSLSRQKYTGFFEVRAALVGDALHPISVHAGLDSNLLPAIRELMNPPLPTFLRSLLSSVKFSSGIRPQYAIAVMISIPPFPFSNVGVEQIPIENYNQHNAKHLWLLDVNKLNGVLRCAGTTGALAYVTAYGNTIKEAKRRVYKTIDRLAIPQIQYREDIGDKFLQTLKKIFQ